METFSALLALCAGNSPVTGEFPSERPVTRNFDVFFNLRLNKRLSRQSRLHWFVTLSRSLWRHCNAYSSKSSTNVTTWLVCLSFTRVSWPVDIDQTTSVPVYAGSFDIDTARKSAVTFLTNIHKRHPIARPLGRGMGCCLWSQHLINILSQFL